MNVSLLAIDNTFTVNAESTSPRCLTSPVTKNTELLPANRPSSTNTTEGKRKTDNTPTIAQKEAVNKQSQNFDDTLRGKVATETPQKVKVSVKSEGQNLSPNVAEQPNIVQLWLAQFSQNTSCDKKGTARRIEPKAGYKLAQSLTKLRAKQPPTVVKQTAKSLANEVPLTVNQSKNGSKAILTNISKGIGTTSNHFAETKNTYEKQISNKGNLATKVPVNQQNSLSNKELTTKIPVDPDNKTITTGEKPAVIIAKPAVMNGKEIAELNSNLKLIQDKSSENQSQTIDISPKKSAFIAEKPTTGKNNAFQQDKASSGLLDGDGKTQTGNPSSDSILQKLNPTQVQLSTNQTKNSRNLTSNNSTDSASEQTLPANNVHLITEAFSQAGKAVNHTSSGVITQGISKQIQESIHSSLRQPDQQIIIRLNPPELGTVSLKFQEQKDQITGLLEVSKAQTRYEIERALPEIIRNLQDLGVQIKRLEVTQQDQSEQQAYKDQSLQDGWSEQHTPAHQYNPEYTPADEWLSNANNYRDISEQQKALITDNSINMLV
jgi:flagellar hook-length control protein FliK